LNVWFHAIMINYPSILVTSPGYSTHFKYFSKLPLTRNIPYTITYSNCVVDFSPFQALKSNGIVKTFMKSSFTILHTDIVRFIHLMCNSLAFIPFQLLFEIYANFVLYISAQYRMQSFYCLWFVACIENFLIEIVF